MTPEQFALSLRCRKAAVCLLFAFLLLTPQLYARFTLEQVLGSPFPSELTAAEHAPRIAWVFDARGVRNIWVADAPGFGVAVVKWVDGTVLDTVWQVGV